MSGASSGGTIMMRSNAQSSSSCVGQDLSLKNTIEKRAMTPAPVLFFITESCCELTRKVSLPWLACSHHPPQLLLQVADAVACGMLADYALQRHFSELCASCPSYSGIVVNVCDYDLCIRACSRRICRLLRHRKAKTRASAPAAARFTQRATTGNSN